MILLDGIKMRDVHQGLVNRRAVFVLFHTEKRSVYRVIDLSLSKNDFRDS